MPIMINLLKVITAVDGASPYIGYFAKLVDTLKKSTLATIPAHISIDDANDGVNGIRKTADSQRGLGPEYNADGPQVLDPIDNLGLKASAHNDVVPKASTLVRFNSQLGVELCSHAHGQAALGATHPSSTDEDIFAPSSENEGSAE